MAAASRWLLAAGRWPLMAADGRRWPMAAAWLLATGCWLLAPGPLLTRCSLLAAGCRGGCGCCWPLLAAAWLLAGIWVGCYLCGANHSQHPTEPQHLGFGFGSSKARQLRS
jgi:hypothetical protein